MLKYIESLEFGSVSAIIGCSLLRKGNRKGLKRKHYLVRRCVKCKANARLCFDGAGAGKVEQPKVCVHARAETKL